MLSRSVHTLEYENVSQHVLCNQKPAKCDGLSFIIKLAKFGVT